jgi:hypothetical protein
MFSSLRSCDAILVMIVSFWWLFEWHLFRKDNKKLASVSLARHAYALSHFITGSPVVNNLNHQVVGILPSE